MAKNERDLIDRNTLKEEIESLRVTVTGLRAGKGVLNEYMKQYRDTVLRVIDEQPAVEVVHGRWIYEPVEFSIVKDIRCSVCRRYVGVPENYCPDCGAKMDGGKDNGKV